MTTNPTTPVQNSSLARTFNAFSTIAAPKTYEHCVFERIFFVESPAGYAVLVQLATCGSASQVMCLHCYQVHEVGRVARLACTR
jgi:hypothetical protein